MKNEHAPVRLRGKNSLQKRASNSSQNSPRYPHLQLQQTMGNRAVAQLIHEKNKTVQFKIPNEEEKLVMQSKSAPGEILAQIKVDRDEKRLNGIPEPLKTGLEALSGTDLSSIRVHKNSNKPAQLNALAYAEGKNIHLGPGQEKHLPHEAWHAVQQAQRRVVPTKVVNGVQINDNEMLEREADKMGSKALQFQPSLKANHITRRSDPVINPIVGQLFRIPPDALLHSVNLSRLNNRALHRRFDQISRELSNGNLSSQHVRQLDREAIRVGEELSRRALRAGSTFDINDVERMKQRFMLAVRRARSGNAEECINVVRAAIGILYGDADPIPQSHRNEMQGAMDLLEQRGRTLGRMRSIHFVDARGQRINSGSGRRPERPEQSIWDVLMEMVRGHFGYSVYGLSVMDNIHSIVLTVDNRPRYRGNPIVRFSDHTTNHGIGWEQMQREPSGHRSQFRARSPRGLDEYITYFTQVHWDDQPSRRKHFSIVRLWRLRATPPPA